MSWMSVELPGNGPWRILDECESRYHNSQTAARGKTRGQIKCVCPRALAVYEQYKAARRARERDYSRERSRRAANSARSVRAVIRHAPQQVTMPFPFLPGAACQGPGGVETMDRALEAKMTAEGMREIDAAKALCATCPVMAECRAFARDHERPAGSWGGVWGGMDAWQRAGFRLVGTATGIKVVAVS